MLQIFRTILGRKPTHDLPSQERTARREHLETALESTRQLLEYTHAIRVGSYPFLNHDGTRPLCIGQNRKEFEQT